MKKHLEGKPSTTLTVYMDVYSIDDTRRSACACVQEHIQEVKNNIEPDASISVFPLAETTNFKSKSL